MPPDIRWLSRTILLVAALFGAAQARADYLGSWALYNTPNHAQGVSHAALTDLGVRVAFGPDADYGAGDDLFEDLYFMSASGVIADSTLDPDFPDIAAQLTNGITTDHVRVETHALPHSVGGAPWDESYWANRPTSTAAADFSAYRLDRIDLEIERLRLEVPGHDPNGDGNWTDFVLDARLHFYGTAVPEPDSIVIAMLAIALATCGKGDPAEKGAEKEQKRGSRKGDGSHL